MIPLTTQNKNTEFYLFVLFVLFEYYLEYCIFCLPFCFLEITEGAC